jgi:glycosyltransferase involved in cell wall biosynthesis
MKKTIVHIIDNLARGGAETMLVTVTKNLPEYNNIIVTLYPQNEFGSDLRCDKLLCLNLHSPLMIPIAALKLRALIKQHKVDMVHSHLFWSTVVARLGVPKKIPLITTIHTFVKTSVEYQPKRMRVIEKLTYLLRKSSIIAVAKGALDEYFDFIKVKPYKAYALYTFVDTAIFNNEVEHVSKTADDEFKMVTVGNLKVQKNHHFLLTAFRQLAAEPWSVSPQPWSVSPQPWSVSSPTTKEEFKSSIHLDIYGNGPLDISLQKMIDEYQLNVSLKGQVADIQNIIGQYDLYVMSSLYEGFALSVLEAMALGMPMLLSDIPSFREQCEDTAIYFSLDDPSDFLNKLMEQKSNPERLTALGQAAKKRATSLFTLTKHLEQLKIIYSNTLKGYGR